MPSETDEFLAEILPRQRAAEQALHNGAVGPRLDLWSHQDPVTLFGASLNGQGWPDLEVNFHQVASWFAECTEFSYDVIAAGASGDLAYTVGYEHSSGLVNGQSRTYTLRVTCVYRREAGTWLVVHRHADFAPAATST